MAKQIDEIQTLEEIQRQNAQLELEERLLRRKQRQEIETQEIASRKQGAIAQEQRRQVELATQSNCHHLKPNGASAIAGQRGHNHVPIYICQYCSKVWNGNELPGHLTVPPERIGGPNT